jgi:hypothetical protein
VAAIGHQLQQSSTLVLCMRKKLHSQPCTALPFPD